MFNIHSTEILLILIVALIVIGPERLPAAVKTAGLWIGRFRRSFYKVKAEIERELNTDEIRRQLHNESVLAQIDEAKAKVESVAKDTETSVNKLVNTDNFDPGASKATDQQSADDAADKSIQEELKEVSDQVEDVAKEIYEPAGNPKVAEDNSVKEVKQDDAVS
ncbi:MAG: Sec-independent protein translocase protein TatB [Gammaproteobacteria bacterium]|nr:Sec-independent protein translocase protein TatB [Gammaproteobacteria bacterium]MDD9895687.1 Sec-independent protein translocase protein TatB [Gammaproteobacteria bacterium]MDD9960134.1 Sec-independent protein translocase protein TatB [Gammaproteobacteria bacterium]